MCCVCTSFISCTPEKEFCIVNKCDYRIHISQKHLLSYISVEELEQSPSDFYFLLFSQLMFVIMYYTEEICHVELKYTVVI